MCNNEAACTCDTTWAGTDCSMPDPPKVPPPAEDEGPKGLWLCSDTNTQLQTHTDRVESLHKTPEEISV